MKFRLLTLEELSELEGDFVKFLAANGIPAETWEKLKAEQSPKVREYMETFSDIVFQQVLEKVTYLEFRSPNEIQCFHCEAESISLLGVKTAEPSELDFTANADWEQMLAQARQSGARLQVYNASKKYHKERVLELFDMMEGGAKISKDGMLYKTLEGVVKGQNA